MHFLMTTIQWKKFNISYFKGRIMCNWLYSIGDQKWIGKNFQQNFENIFQFTLLILNHVLWVKSIGNPINQLESFATSIFDYNWLEFYSFQLTFDVAIDFLMFAIEFTQSTWFTTTKWIGKSLQKISWKFFQLTFSLQFTLVNCTWSGPKIEFCLYFLRMLNANHIFI